jgi:hypothetical protein
LPTFERLRRFDRDYDQLSREEKRAFQAAVRKFVADLEAGAGFRKGLRVKGVQGSTGLYEMTWADNGRATFSYGEAIRERHIVWRRVGAHDVIG